MFDAYEHASQPPLPFRSFVWRLTRHVGVAGLLVGPSLLVGIGGFHWLCGLSPSDSVLDAAMLLGGMGPVGDLTRVRLPGKLFAAGFALYAGLVFLIVTGLLLAPVVHRVLHLVHWERRS